MEPEPIRMSLEGFGHFVNVLSRPPAPVPEMVDLLRRRAPWELQREAER
ncbi:MAG: hypothetical protein R3E09_18830 [Novosphingobium sp.]